MTQTTNSTDEIGVLESERNKWRHSLNDFDSKKDFSGTIFLIGSIYLVITLVLSPIFSLLLSVGLMVWGLVVYIKVAIKNKKADNMITEISSDIVRLRTKTRD